MVTDMAVFFNTDEFAETISYTPLDGIPVDITGILTLNQPLQEPYIRGANMAKAEIVVKKTEVTNPQYGDLFTLNPDELTEEIWEYDASLGVINEDDDTLTIALERQI